MRYYQIFKITPNGLLPMGAYEGRNGQQAIDKMARKGVISGSEWAASYHAIPSGPHFRKLNVTPVK